MKRIREYAMNGLLAILVLSSMLLSARVWFPSDHRALQRSTEPRIEAPPPGSEGRLPDIFRPELIRLRKQGGAEAVLQSGSEPYGRVWSSLRNALTDLTAAMTPTLAEMDEAPDAQSITLELPFALSLAEWAERWGWFTGGLRYRSAKIDRVIFFLGQPPSVYLTGPAGSYYQLVGVLASLDEQLVQEVIDSLADDQFAAYRPMQVKELPLRLALQVTVPDVTEVPVAVLQPSITDTSAEELRYFPDLSVVRQIEEKEARSFTDGQRLLRLTSSGLLEYRAVQTTGHSPDLATTLAAAQEWVSTRGGWSQQLVLAGYLQRPGSTTLSFDIRLPGPYPVESVGGAVQIEVTATREAVGGEWITYFRRSPAFVQFFDSQTEPIITPEEALKKAVLEYPNLSLTDSVRGVHLAYRLQVANPPGGTQWTLEPTWVFQIGGARLYVPATSKTE